MPLDPHLAQLLELTAAVPQVHEGTVEQARDGLRALMITMRDPSTVRQTGSVNDEVVAGRPVRVYRPVGDGSRPTVAFFHGGGFVLGDLDTHDAACTQLAEDVGAVVVSVDYRRAPEAPWPAAVDDCFGVLRGIADDIDAYGGDADRLAVAGDSAGGNLAAVCAQLARAAGLPLAAQLLVYPAVDLLGDYPSRTENAEGYLLTLADMEWFGRHYLGFDETDPRAADAVADPRLSPILAESLDGLAPAVVATMEFDPLRDEGNAYAAALEKAGVPVRHRQFDGMIHGVYGQEHMSPGVAAVDTWIHEQLADLLR